jgi:hypothetical protein
VGTDLQVGPYALTVERPCAEQDQARNESTFRGPIAHWLSPFHSR